MAFDKVQSSLLLLTEACEISFKEIGTGANEANNKIGKLQTVVQVVQANIPHQASTREDHQTRQL